MSYLNQILDRLGEDSDVCIYELYLQNNLNRFCNIKIEDFEDIYFALFDDSVDDLENATEIIFNSELYEDYNERIKILYNELLYDCNEYYSYVRFLAEIDKKQWPDIIEKNVELQKIKIESRVFDFYNKLRTGRLDILQIIR